MSFAAGTVLDRYTVEGVLGQGGMAIVYRVRHNQLGTTHAMKVLHAPSHAVRDRMLQEGRVQGQLRHPNIVPVTDLVEIAGSPGLVMEFIDGPSMEALLEKFRPTIEQADALAVAILEGVAYAHRMGFIHRDLKPANVLLAVTDAGLVPKVTDFGLAKLVHGDQLEGMNQTRSGMVMGTPAYMAPEQIRDSKSVDHRADIFSLGVMLYELVSGAKPFTGADIVQLYTAITKGSYPPISDLVPNIPDRMERAIAGALVTDRNQRIQDTDRLLAIWRGDVAATKRAPKPKGPWVPDTAPAKSGMPEMFVPQPQSIPDQEITFHDDGPTPVPAADVAMREHDVLKDLARIRIAPTAGSAEARHKVMISIAPNDELGEVSSPNLPRVYQRSSAGWVVGFILVLLVVASVIGFGGAVAMGVLVLPPGMTTADAAPTIGPPLAETPPAPTTLPATAPELPPPETPPPAPPTEPPPPAPLAPEAPAKPVEKPPARPEPVGTSDRVPADETRVVPVPQPETRIIKIGPGEPAPPEGTPPDGTQPVVIRVVPETTPPPPAEDPPAEPQTVTVPAPDPPPAP